jgi:protein tyrosine/serine phosphatase
MATKLGWRRGCGVAVCVLIGMLPGCNPEALTSSQPLPSNFHVLDPGRAYRSAQPDDETLRGVIAQYGIRTVVNLRGTNPGDAWYDTEAAVCQELGVTLSDHALSAQHLPSPELLGGVLDTLQTAEYPILIHCMSGADRTGAVSAIYRMLMAGDSREAALAQLSPLYLHLRAYAPCMDTLAELYQPGTDWLMQYAGEYEGLTCH